MTMAQETHYDVLQVTRECSADDIRRAYHRAARQHHPDKQGERANEALFLRVQAAYEVLRDPTARVEYDKQLAQDALCRQRDVEDVRIADEIAVSEMEREEIVDEECGDDGDARVVVYSHQCRCGDAYEITQEELEDGVDIVPCNGCSLNIRVRR
ncbi:hypothetical protein PINS_up011247 [Pythium insidiosum]|nr:hypothetical protein PINS_up011247 [Pythium insidiosum]